MVFICSKAARNFAGSPRPISHSQAETRPSLFQHSPVPWHSPSEQERVFSRSVDPVSFASNAPSVRASPIPGVWNRIHRTSARPGGNGQRVSELFRCCGLPPLEVEEFLEIRVALQIAEHTLQNRMSADKAPAMLVEPEQKLVVRIFQLPSRVQNIIIDLLSRSWLLTTVAFRFFSKCISFDEDDDPVQFILVAIAGWMNQRQRQTIEHLGEENRVLPYLRGSRGIETRDGITSQFKMSSYGAPLNRSEKIPPSAFCDAVMVACSIIKDH
jgi:hypothetical protein